MLQDLRFGLRMLVRSPGFAFAAIAALGLGIGASTAVFTVLDGVVLRPLPYPYPDRLVTIWDVNASRRLPHETVSPVTFLDDRQLTQVFEDAAAWWRPNFNLTDAGRDPMRVSAIEVSANFFEVLGVRPALGSGFPATPFFSPDGMIVISYRLWQARYAGDPKIVGRSLQLNGQLYTVAGVMGRDFNYPPDVDIYQRLSWNLAFHTRGAHFMETVARLKRGVTIEQANAELAALRGRIAREFAATNAGWSAYVTPLHQEVVGFFRPALYALVGAVLLLLLVACINVANLLLARATVREREVAVRAAIGAGRGRLIRQLLTESLVLGAAGAASGIAIAFTGVRLFVGFTPIAIPRLDQVFVDWRALAFAIAASGATVVAFGVVPALFVARTDLQTALKAGARGAGAGIARRRARTVLVVAEVGLAVALLVAAGLLVRSVQQLTRENPGFVPSGIVTASVEVPQRQYQDWKAVARFYAAFGETLRAVPGVTAAGFTNAPPLSPGWRLPFFVKGRPQPKAGDEPRAQFATVDESYFQLLGVSLRRGRWLNERDDVMAPGVVLINESLARAYWPDQDPVGQTIRSLAAGIGPLGRSLMSGPEFQIVGVVADAKNASLQAATEPGVFFSQRQYPFRSMYVLVRGSGGTESVASAIRVALGRLDPSLPLAKVSTVERMIGEPIDRPRLLMTIMTAFAGLALLLAALGIYGVMSYGVNQRRQELSVRIALGADGGSIVWLVVRQGLTLAAFGIVAGAIGGHVIGRIMSSLLFGVTPADPTTFAAVPALVAVVAVVACLLPARRAAATDPINALRGESTRSIRRWRGAHLRRPRADAPGFFPTT